MTLVIELILLCIFLILSAFFSGVETAFVSLNELRLQHLIDKNIKGATRVKKLKDNYQHLIITLLVGNNLVNIAASSLATVIAVDLFGSNGVGIAIGVMTFVVLIWGEITPKTIAMGKNEFICLKTAKIIDSLGYVLYPLIRLLEVFSKVLSNLFVTENKEPVITEEEIKSVINLGEQIGEVEKDEREMIHNIFRFSDMVVEDIMTPRTRVFSIDDGIKIKDVLHTVNRSGYSRIPAYTKKEDHISGILYVKDMLLAIEDKKEGLKVKDILKPAIFVPENKRLDDLLRLFQKRKVHIAIIVDEHGGVSGIVTIEDLLEEIVGDIYDESDVQRVLIRKMKNKTFLVKGEADIEDINRVCNLSIKPRTEYDTISGYLLYKLRRIPRKGEMIHIKKANVIVEKVNNQAILEVRIAFR